MTTQLLPGESVELLTVAGCAVSIVSRPSMAPKGRHPILAHAVIDGALRGDTAVNAHDALEDLAVRLEEIATALRDEAGHRLQATTTKETP